MCAIAGIVRMHPSAKDRQTVAEMLLAMNHRGPDGSNIYSRPQVTLGHNRLSILDLSERASQPMANAAGDLVITYNGEIYNYKELAQWLGTQAVYRSSSDTEVLLKCYEREETACFNKLNGIFSFAVWDERTKRLVLARDHFGVKPLYWYAADDLLIFASELKGILASGLVPRQVNPEAVHHYLSIQAVPPPLTMIEGVHMLPAGSYLQWHDGRSHIQTYYTLEFGEDDSLGRHPEPYLEKTQQLVTQAIANQRQADVPIGVALSGGIDSSIILATLAKYNQPSTLTFTLTDEMLPEGVLDDGYYARVASSAFLSEHTELYLKQHELLQMLPKVIWAQGQPSLRNMLSFFLFHKIRHQVKVVLYGTAGDELFAGYGTNQLLQQFKKRGQFMNGAMPLIHQMFNLFPRLYEFFPQADYTFKVLTSASLYRQRQVVDWVFLDEEKAALYHPTFRQSCRDYNSAAYFQQWADGSHTSAIKQHQQLDWLGIITEHLAQLDAVSMANSIEARVPFLDKQLVSFAAKLPGFILAPDGRDNKYLLRQSFKTVLPQSLIHRPKTGFHISFETYMATTFQPLCRFLFLEDKMDERAIFSYRAVQTLLSGYRLHPHRLHRAFEKLSLLVNLELWQRIFIDGRSVDDLSQELMERCAQPSRES